MKDRMIPAALAVASFLVTFAILSWQEGRWPLGKPAVHASVTGTLEKGGALSRLTPRGRGSFWTATPPTLPAPTLKTAAQPASIDTAAQEEAPAPSDESDHAPVDAAVYLAERSRETTHSSRTR